MKPSERVGRERLLRAAVLAGDEQAWRLWYDECFTGLHLYALWRCAGLRDRAEEIVQETWLTAVQRIRAFDPEAGSFANWLRGIAANHLRNAFRRELRRRQVLSLPGHSGLDAGLTQMETREQAERVAIALSTLPGHYEAVLRAKYLDQKSMAEIALERGESLKAVESLLTRAREAFRHAFAQE
jgi:RNA polymerase sigma-70 factor (ECF subfamily)